MAKELKVSIIILNYNGHEDTLECLKSLKGLLTDNCRVEVVVVDNGSTDSSPESLSNFQLSTSNFQLIKNKKNLGFSGGNNVGIKYALKNKADYLLLLNNDTLVDKSLLLQLIKAAENYEKAGILSPKIYFAPGFEFHKKRYKKSELGKIIWYAGGKFDWKNLLGSNRGVDELDKGQYDKVEETDFASGACMLIRAQALKEVGFFDEEYFMYLEDVDLCQRMKKKGWQILYLPSAHLWHKVARSSGIGSNLNDYFITRNRLLFAIKYASLRAKLALFKESLKFLLSGREWQKKAVRDFYLCRLGQGSWK